MAIRGWGRTFIAGVIVLVAATGCSKSSSESSSGGTVTIGMALAAPKNDHGFAQAHYEGLVQAQKKLHFKSSVVANALSETQRVNALTSLARSNQLVIGVGGEFAQSAPQVAKQFPDVTFVIVNGLPQPGLDNYHAFDYREGVPAYIAGVVLAKLTKGGHAAFVGGELIPTAAQARDAFTAGLHSVNPDIQVDSTIVGTFQDPQKTQAATAAAIANGADVLYGYEAGTGWPGMVEAAKSASGQVFVASNIFDKCSFGKFIVGNALLSGTENTVEIIRDFIQEKLPSGTVGIGVQNPKVQNFTLCPGYERFSSVVKDTTDKINSGAIKLPEGV
jgi:basic membrane protein A